MIYLAANNTKVHRLAACGYPMGWMLSPAGGWKNPRSLPYAIDNGLFHKYGEPAKGMKALPEFYRLLDKTISRSHAPMFVAVPDVPYDGRASLELSRRHLWHVKSRGVSAALVVQDGMTPDDIPAGFDWLFVGGSTEWKWITMADWVREAHARGMYVHVGRVNTWRRINACIDDGADSADGTGIFRGDKHQLGTVLCSLRTTGLFGQRACGWPVSVSSSSVVNRNRGPRILHAA